MASLHAIVQSQARKHTLTQLAAAPHQQQLSAHHIQQPRLLHTNPAPTTPQLALRITELGWRASGWRTTLTLDLGVMWGMAKQGCGLVCVDCVCACIAWLLVDVCVCGTPGLKYGDAGRCSMHACMHASFRLVDAFQQTREGTRTMESGQHRQHISQIPQPTNQCHTTPTQHHCMSYATGTCDAPPHPIMHTSMHPP